MSVTAQTVPVQALDELPRITAGQNGWEAVGSLSLARQPVERGKSRVREGETVFEGRRGRGVVRGGEASGLTGEDSSHGRVPGDDFP